MAIPNTYAGMPVYSSPLLEPRVEEPKNWVQRVLCWNPCNDFYPKPKPPVAYVVDFAKIEAEMFNLTGPTPWMMTQARKALIVSPDVIGILRTAEL